MEFSSLLRREPQAEREEKWRWRFILTEEKKKRRKEGEDQSVRRVREVVRSNLPPTPLQFPLDILHFLLSYSNTILFLLK